MDAASGYDAGKLYAFERDKLAKVQGLLGDSFNKVQAIMEKFSDEKYKDVISAFGQQFEGFRQAVTQVLTSPMPMSMRDPFQELAALQVERQQGYDKLNSLNDEMQRLRDQNAQQTKLIEELQGQSKLGQNRVSTFSEQNNDTNGNNEDPPYSNPLHFDDPQDTIVQLTNELETAQMNVGQLRRTADELTNQNKRLSVEVLQLRDQVNQSHNPYLNASNLFDNGSHSDAQIQNQSEIQGLNSMVEQLRIENGSLKEEVGMRMAEINELKRKIESLGGSAKHLFRADTVTNWDPNALEELKKEMNKQKLAMMTNRQMNMAQGNDPNMESINEDEMNGMANGQNDGPRPSEKHLYRADTKQEWDKDQLAMLKNELMSELHDQNKSALAEQFDKAMRFPEERRATNLIQGASDLGQLTQEEIEAKQEAMRLALLEEKKRLIMNQTEKGFALRESQENQGVLQLDDLEEAKQRLIEMQKKEAKDKLKKLFEKQDDFIAPVVEPSDEQYEQLDGFLKNVLGLLNENIRQRTINELKTVFVERQGGIGDDAYGVADNSTKGGNNSLLGNDAARGSQPHSGAQTPQYDINNNNNNNKNKASNSLLDDENDGGLEADLLYTTPGGGVTTQGGDYDTPGGPNENQIASEEEWQRMVQDQTQEINRLTKELNSKNEEINRLSNQVLHLESEIENLNNNGNNMDSNKNDYNNNNSDGRNINENEINKLKNEIKDLTSMKLELVRSTTSEMNHLRGMIRDMQKRISGSAL